MANEDALKRRAEEVAVHALPRPATAPSSELRGHAAPSLVARADQLPPLVAFGVGFGAFNLLLLAALSWLHGFRAILPGPTLFLGIHNPLWPSDRKNELWLKGR